jgi:preprotein translocase subunit SecE
MSTKVTTAPEPLDTVKLVIALLLLAGAVIGFHYFADAPKVARVGGVIAAVLVAFAIASFSARGRQVAAFVRDAQLEARKVVWPTRQETQTTTLLVFAAVIVFAILLWLLDLALGWLIQFVIGTGA